MWAGVMLVVGLAAGSTGGSQDAAAEAPPLASRWADANDVTGAGATGAVEVCDLVTTPVGWIPNVGTALSFVAEWGCLVPGAVAGDYVQRQHGTQRGQLWQAVVALAVGKVWRDVTRLAVGATVVVTGVGVLAVAAAATGALSLTVWPVAPLFLPLALAGVLVWGAVTYTVVREFRKGVQEALFGLTYRLLTGQYASETDQWKAQDGALLRPAHNIAERNLHLLALASGMEAEHSLWHWVPVVGPVLRGIHKADRMENVLRRVAAEDIREQPLSWPVLNTAVRVFTVTEGVLGALTQVALTTGALMVVGAGLLALAQLPLGLVRPPQLGPPEPERWAVTWRDAVVRSGPLALVTGLLGVAALTVVASGVVFVLLREVPKFVMPWMVPLVFGPLPRGDWFPPRDGPRAARVPAAADPPAPLSEEVDRAVDGWVKPPDATTPAPDATAPSNAPPSTAPAEAAPPPDAATTPALPQEPLPQSPAPTAP